jgi:hypothetical protein
VNPFTAAALDCLGTAQARQRGRRFQVAINLIEAAGGCGRQVEAICTNLWRCWMPQRRKTAFAKVIGSDMAQDRFVTFPSVRL